MTLDALRLESPYLELEESFYEARKVTPLDSPYLISVSEDALKLLGLEDEVSEEALVAVMNGELRLKGSTPFAMAYAGHQFGNYNPWLGDGRAINLGKAFGWNIQLKGAGETLYSRMDDGRSVMASSIREYLMSEAMHHLGIPTTRALGIIGSTTKAFRQSGTHHASIVMRLSSSWVRFGSFEYFYYQKQYDKLESLAEYVIEESYPHLIGDEQRFFKMFCEILERTALLIAKWQGIGFMHGVMNTDNMSIEGLTLDYGPFAMLDDFNYNTICNKSDRAGRYAYGEQPNIAYWNLTMLSKALSPLVSQERMDKKLDEFGTSIYSNAYISVMKKKLGLMLHNEGDKSLIEKLVSTLHEALVDHTLFFRTLSRYDGDRSPLYDIAMNPIVIDEWLKLYDLRLKEEMLTQSQRQKVMLETNPKYILKNYMLEKAIKLAEAGNLSMIGTLLDLARHPYHELPQYEHFAGDTPEEFKNMGLSCSS